MSRRRCLRVLWGLGVAWCLFAHPAVAAPEPAAAPSAAPAAAAPASWAEAGPQGMALHLLRVWGDGYVLVFRDGAGVKVVELDALGVPRRAPARLAVESNARVHFAHGLLFVGDVERASAARLSVWRLDGTAVLEPVWLKEFLRAVDLSVEAWAPTPDRAFATATITDMGGERVDEHFHIDLNPLKVRAVTLKPQRRRGMVEVGDARVQAYAEDRLPEWFDAFERAVRLTEFPRLHMVGAAAAGRTLYLFGFDEGGLTVRPMKAPEAAVGKPAYLAPDLPKSDGLFAAGAGPAGGVATWAAAGERPRLHVRTFNPAFQFGALQTIDLAGPLGTLAAAARPEGALVVASAGAGDAATLLVLPQRLP